MILWKALAERQVSSLRLKGEDYLMKDGTFRKKKGFTAVQNSVAKDKTLSMKAKGLYLLIQAYITMPGSNWKKSDFEDMCMEGSKAFNSAWDELKKKGYLHVHIYSGNGIFKNEYELMDEKTTGPHTFYYNCRGELTKTNEDRYPQNGSNGDGINGNGINADGNNYYTRRFTRPWLWKIDKYINLKFTRWYNRKKQHGYRLGNAEKVKTMTTKAGLASMCG